MKKYNYNFSGDSGVFQSWFKGEGTVVLPEKGRVWKTPDAGNIIFLNKNGVVEPEDCPYVLEYTTTDGQPIDNTWESDVINTFNESGKVQFARPCDTISLHECLTLNTLTLPNGLTEINFGNFGNCYNLTSVIIPNSVSYISDGGFVGCNLLSDISYLGSVDECRQALMGELISVPALYIQCSDGQFPLVLEYLYTTVDGNPIYPTSYKTSEYVDNQGVLYTSLNNLTLNSFAFEGQTTLQSIILPDDLEVIGQGAFSGCSSLESVTLGTNLKEIGAEAFNECGSLTEITIPENVEAISENVFYRCSSLPVENNLRYADTYLVEAVDKTLSTYSIKKGTKWIGSDAFKGCTSLTSITIPNSVTSIGESAFENCTGLTSITFPNSVTSIGNLAFNSCSGLTSITIGNSVTWIGDYAFRNCTMATSITCEATTPPLLGSSNDLSNVTAVYVPSESVEAYKNATNWSYYSDVIQAIP